jgi:hypothetical protein
MGKHKQVECIICFKSMRSDNVKGHMKVHVKYNQPEKYEAKIQTNEEMCRELVLDLVDKAIGKVDEPTATKNDWEDVKQAGMKRKYNEVASVNKIDTQALKKALLKKSQEYSEKVSLGEEIYKILGEGEVESKSLTLEWKEALDTYIKQKPLINYDDITLKPWQEELMSYITNPSDRKVIWVLGSKCGEGKSWFQEYVETLF